MHTIRRVLRSILHADKSLARSRFGDWDRLLNQLVVVVGVGLNHNRLARHFGQIYLIL